jgi:hypothetical protein
VGGAAESSYSPDDRTLPVVDPELDSLPNQEQYVQTAVKQRSTLAHRYLNEWNAQLLSGFDQYAKMSQFAGLWRSFTCGYLEHLLNVEYPKTNLPMLIYGNPLATADSSATLQTLQRHYTYISVVYWKKLPEMLPGLFKNPLDADDQAFAEVHLFIPRKRLAWVRVPPPSQPAQTPLGGVPGQTAYAPPTQSSGTSGGGGGASHWVVGRVMAAEPPNDPRLGGPGLVGDWNLLNQSWDCQLAPVTQPALATILQTNPDLPGFTSGEYKLPNLGGLSSEELQQISPH